jgi:hypothetical protein
VLATQGTMLSRTNAGINKNYQLRGKNVRYFLDELKASVLFNPFMYII